MREKDLILALEMLTEGSRGKLPTRRAGAAFATESLREAADQVKRRSRPWMAARGIQGFGIAERTVAGTPTPDLALKVYVDRKRPKAQLRAPVPPRVELPELGTVETDVEAIGRVERELFTARVRPAMPGCGLGHHRITVGTFGCLVRKRNEPKDLYILSNSHVLAESGLGAAGDAIVQPGSFDGGRRPVDTVATLDTFVPFQYTGNTFPNLVDAAIARVANASLVAGELRVLRVRPTAIRRNPRRGLEVQKVGRTTDHTIGIVRDVNYRVALNYEVDRRRPPRTRRVGFRDQVLCSRYTAGGDSGSLVLDRANRAVGLHFAGSPSTSIFSKIVNVLNLLDIELA